VRNTLLSIFTVLVLLVLFVESSIAQTDSSKNGKRLYKEKSLFSIGAGHQRGFIFAHSQAVQNTKGSYPKGLELILSWQRNDAAVWDLCNCYPRKGLLLAYYDYDNSILGSSFSAAYFLEPKYRLHKNLFFSFKGTSGFSYLTRPFDSINNPANQSYSTHLSAYLMVRLGFWFRLNQHWWLNASANYQHVSNGGLRQPNKGINWPTAGLALSYQKTSRPFYTGARIKEKFWKNHALRWDAGLFGMARRAVDADGTSRRLPLIGFALQASKQFGRINALNLGTELYRDEALLVQLKRDSVNASPVKAGILAGHAFLLGRFLFSQRLGVYVFDQTPYYDRLYHRWGINYGINRHIGLGISLQAHRQVADFVDLRFTYTFQNYTSTVH
jgi:hypothetical protein